MTSKYDRGQERWKSLKARVPDFLEQLAALEASLRIVMVENQVPLEWEDELLARKDVRAAMAKRERALRSEMLSGNAKAEVLLKADFDLRPATGKTVKEAFGDTIRALHSWVEAHPAASARDAYAELYRLVTRGGKTTAERRAEHAGGAPAVGGDE